MSQQPPTVLKRNHTSDSVTRLRVQFQTSKNQSPHHRPLYIDSNATANRSHPQKSPYPALLAGRTLIPTAVQTNPNTVNATNPAFFAGAAPGRTKQTQPLRSTKTSQKLVLFPEDAVDKSIPPEEDIDFDETASVAAGYVLPLDFTVSGRTDAERKKREEREASRLPRVTAYCTAEGYHLEPLRKFLREKHDVLPRLYDECLYVPYHFPLAIIPTPFRAANRKDNDDEPRVRSGAWARSPGGGSVLDRQLANFEEQNMDFEEDHYYVNAMENQFTEEEIEYRVALDAARDQERLKLDENGRRRSEDTVVIDDQVPGESSRLGDVEQVDESTTLLASDPAIDSLDEYSAPDITNTGAGPNSSDAMDFIASYNPVRFAKPFEGGELFIFDYGVVVFWNFPQATELLLLEDMASFRAHPVYDPENMQIEEMHFQYDTSQAQPRIFNDMITLKSGNHMIKLTISHAISQSAVLTRFEDMMEVTIEDTKHIPKKLAQTGRLDMSRTEMTKINGRLFKLRMNVNLVSNVLDTPEIFWSEPSLQPLYNAIRGYLEIPQRAKILNDRCTVISDMLSMLREHMSSSFVSYQTWIIIWLIVVAVIVAIVSVDFGMGCLGVWGCECAPRRGMVMNLGLVMRVVMLLAGEIAVKSLNHVGQV
ncbi:hypothetical protein BC938DRAFT_482540 [Jimgerdemannia flammicorona]|uniref:DUF155 domain-containing protein n=2 Tax=Jimgerdemannia flammicorona TaxID=994334 RepID=A0A433QDW4_9FUNG|nr:hypothetical protein BC938DRAFT_482540 [Jimgerdemannia flammicorona]